MCVSAVSLCVNGVCASECQCVCMCCMLIVLCLRAGMRVPQH